MENKVSSLEERKLTNAIERAATVCSIREDLDRNATLAEQLKKASVDPKFAKVASAAFNKRITVLTFKKTADEHKAEPFQLTDEDKVYELLSGKKPETKTASAQFRMSLDDWSHSMEKAASAPVKDNRYENKVDMQTYLDHIESMMEKYAFALQDMIALKTRVENDVENQAEEVAGYFKNASYDYDFTTAVNLYGDKLKDAIGTYLDKGISFEKTASYVIKPQREIFNKVAKLLETKEALDSINMFLGEYGKGLAEFCKSAAALGDEYLIKRADLTQSRADASQAQTDAAKALADAIVEAQKYQTHSVEPVITGIGQGVLGAAAGAAATGFGAATEISGAAKTLLDNAKAKYYAGNNVSISPGDLLDAKFLTKDRYRDRLLAWSDMSADPQLAMYPAEQVFQATNKAMDMDTSMERPDQREVLRAQVAQLLAQNNRVSTADIAALAETLKALSEVRGSAAQEADKAVSALSAKTAPEAVQENSVVGVYGNRTPELAKLRDDLNKNVEDAEKEMDAQKQDAQKRLDDAVKERSKDKERADNRVQQLEDRQEDRDFNEQKRIDADNRKQIADTQAKADRDKSDKANKVDAMKRALIRSKLNGDFVPTRDSKGELAYRARNGSSMLVMDKDVQQEAEDYVNSGATIPGSGGKKGRKNP